VILLGQETDPPPGQAAAAPGEALAAATAHAPETARAQAAPAEDAAAAEAAAATTDTAAKVGTAHGAAAARDAATTETATTGTPATAKAAAPKEGTARSTAAAGDAATEAAATDAAAEDVPAGPATAAAEAAASSTSSATGAAATQAAPAPDRAPQPAPADAGLFARYTRDYVTGHDGHQIMILQAGCTTADGDLGVGVLREAGADIAVSLIDDDQPVTRAALGADENLAGCVQGDLRTVPLPPRSHDIVLCALLLQRIEHAELVLDRLVAAIRPGGLLLLRFNDRDSSAGFLDRVMPLAARNAVWRKRRPGRPGPYPAVYERLSSARGVQAYALKRELVIAERQALGGLAGALAEPRGFLAAQQLVAWLSRGRLTAAHEELVYVLRKPEDRFARIL
jgi:SAM-dependent methyltransferase